MRIFYFLVLSKKSYELPSDFRRPRYVKSKISKALEVQQVSEVWRPSVMQKEKEETTFWGINLATMSGRNREQLGETVEKSTSQLSLDTNSTAETGFTKAMWRSSFLSVSGTPNRPLPSAFRSNWGKTTFFLQDKG